VSNFFSWLVGVHKDETSPDEENGQIYVSNNIEFNNQRTYRSSITT